MTAQEIEKQRRDIAEEGAPFEVHEDNWLTAQAFLALQTQWQREVIVGDKVIFIYKGLNHASFPTAMDMVGAKPEQRQEIYLGLRLMETAALSVLNELDDD